jgi:hypothetical protein
MLAVFVFTTIAIATLFLAYACFGFGGTRDADNWQVACALEEVNPSDYHSYAVAPAKQRRA